MSWDWLGTFFPALMRGVGVTLMLTLISGALGLLLALGVAFARLSRNPLLSWPSLAFVGVIRGTPLLVQIYILYYGLGSLFATMPALRGSALWPYLREGFWYVALALTISVGAYVGEVIRGGLLSAPRGELEAARAIGMSKGLMIRRVWLPRALGIVLPTLAGESVLLLKSTALASTVAVMDLLGAANLARSRTFLVYEPLITAAVLYIALAFLIEAVFRRIERTSPAASSFHRRAR